MCFVFVLFAKSPEKARIADLQSMLNICISELCCLDMKINSKKSSCIRFGKNFNHESVHIKIDGVLLPWSSHLKYLGVTLKSSIIFAVDFKHSRSGFYKSFNAIYSKVSRAIIFSLILK